MNELIQQARELCDAAKSAKERGNALDSAAMSWAITNNCVPQLCEALEAAEKALIDCHHTQKVADGKTAENARLRKINELLTARAEKAESENRWISVSERLPEVPLFEQADDDWITDRGYPFLVTYDYGDVGIESFWSKTGFSDCEAPVTHWRPLPEPPKDTEAQR